MRQLSFYMALRKVCVLFRLMLDSVHSTSAYLCPERQIYFDLYGCGPTISRSWIKSGVDYLKFEDVLQYVAVPQVQVEGQPVSNQRSSKRQLKMDGQGRTDLEFLFKWLKGVGVKTILKVIVDDLQEPAHSDGAIEAALKGMSVEDWDWRKTDLCLEVIHTVAPTARIVHLYWSGNNATLRGWGEIEGLAKLEKLEKVNLHVRQVSLAIQYHPTAPFPLLHRIRLESDTSARDSKPLSVQINTCGHLKNV